MGLASADHLADPGSIGGCVRAAGIQRHRLTRTLLAVLAPALHAGRSLRLEPLPDSALPKGEGDPDGGGPLP
jgi:hypothetical protein